MDSIEIEPKHWATNQFGYVFTIVQKSIRFAKMKRLVVYLESKYMGSYEIVEIHNFRVKNLSNMLSLMMFGDHCKYGVDQLKTFKIKGRMSDETEMSFICLRFTEYDEKFKLKLKDYDQLRNEKQKQMDELRSSRKDVAPF